MSKPNFQKRLERCAALMQAQGLDALILTKPANMFYLTGDGRLCAYAFITSNGAVTLGVSKQRTLGPTQRLFPKPVSTAR